MLDFLLDFIRKATTATTTIRPAMPPPAATGLMEKLAWTAEGEPRVRVDTPELPVDAGAHPPNWKKNEEGFADSQMLVPSGA